MPLTKARLIQTVEVLLHKAMSHELQSRVQELLADPQHDELALRRLHCKAIYWTHVKNQNHHFYILARFEWSDGSQSRLQWRIPNSRFDGSIRAADKPRIHKVALDKWTWNRYPPGVRAGSGAAEGRGRRSSPARRPKNGRAIAAYRRSRGHFSG